MIRIDATAIGVANLVAGTLGCIGCITLNTSAFIEFTRSIAVEFATDVFGELLTAFSVQINFFATFTGREITVAAYRVFVMTRTFYTGLVAFTRMRFIAHNAMLGFKNAFSRTAKFARDISAICACFVSEIVAIALFVAFGEIVTAGYGMPRIDAAPTVRTNLACGTLCHIFIGTFNTTAFVEFAFGITCKCAIDEFIEVQTGFAV